MQLHAGACTEEKEALIVWHVHTWHSKHRLTLVLCRQWVAFHSWEKESDAKCMHGKHCRVAMNFLSLHLASFFRVR